MTKKDAQYVLDNMELFSEQEVSEAKSVLNIA